MSPPVARKADRADPESAQDWAAAHAGVICAFEFSGGVGQEVGQPRLEPAARPGDWSWTHLRLGDLRGQALLRSASDLPEDALELFVAGEDRLQISEAGGWVFGVLPDLERDLSRSPLGAGRLVFAFDGGRLVTARLRALLAIDDLRRSAERGEVLASPAAAIVAYVQIYLDRVEVLLDELGRKLALAEEYILTEPRNPEEAELGALRRPIGRHRRELHALRIALTRARAGRRHARRPESFMEELGELIAAVEDIDQDAAVLQERARLLHEEIDTLINSATNRSMRALTVLSTLLIPPTLVTGAFGMNLAGIPFGHSAQGFAIVATLCATVVIVALAVLKRMGM